MITLPDRLGELAKSIEAGEPVDLKKTQALQALDIVRLGRQFVEQSITSHEAFDDQLQKTLMDTANN